MLGRRRSKLEEFIEGYSYEEITETEVNFILDLYEAVSTLHKKGEKISLIALSAITRVSPSELSDYLPYIISMEEQLDSYGS